MKKGSMLLLAFAIVALILPDVVKAAAIDDWNISGSVQMQTFRYRQSHDRRANQEWWDTYLGVGQDGFVNTQWDLNTDTSRINFSATQGNVTSVVELRPNADSPIRLFYGKWNFGVGDLTIGQAWTPLNMWYSNQVGQNWNSMIGYGAMWELRKPMIQVKVGGLKVALVKPIATDLWDRARITTDKARTTYPKAEGSYNLGLGPIVIDLYGGYSTYKVEATATKDITIKAYTYGAGVTANLGPLKATIAGYQAQNGTIMGLNENFNYATDTTPELSYKLNKVNNAKSTGIHAVLSYVISPMFTVEGGLGQLRSEIQHQSSPSWDDIYQKQKVSCLYVQVQITLAKNVLVTPEFGMIDYGGPLYKNDAISMSESGMATPEPDGGKEMYFGAQWEVKF